MSSQKQFVPLNAESTATSLKHDIQQRLALCRSITNRPRSRNQNHPKIPAAHLQPKTGTVLTLREPRACQKSPRNAIPQAGRFIASAFTRSSTYRGKTDVIAHSFSLLSTTKKTNKRVRVDDERRPKPSVRVRRKAARTVC